MLFESFGRGPTNVGDIRDKALDAGDLLQRLRADGGVVEDDVDLPEELAQTVGCRPGKDGRPGQQEADPCQAGGKQTSGPRREVHMSNIGCLGPYLI